MGRVGSSPTGRTGWPFGVGLAKIEYVNVSVAELADALDLGSSAFGRVGSTPTGHTGGKRVSCISSCRSRPSRVIVREARLGRINSTGRVLVL